MIEIIFCLTATNLLTLALAIYLYSQKRKPVKPPESIELQDFLGDLMTGGGLVHVSRVDPQNVLLRSARR